jgi:hypothetical protein
VSESMSESTEVIVSLSRRSAGREIVATKYDGGSDQ